MQFDAVVQVTAAGEGVPGRNGSSVHVVPFHPTAVAPPTAVHAEDVVQDTPDSAPLPAGLGVGLHAVPFHRSASLAPGVVPTAMHELAEVHDTADRAPPPAGLGIGWMFHSVPFQCSAIGSVTPEASR